MLKEAKRMEATEEDIGQEAELQTLVRLARKYMWAGEKVRQTLEDAKVYLARNDFYSEYPTLQDVRTSFEYDSRDGEGGPHPVFDDVDIFNKNAIADYARTLSTYASCFNAPVEESDGFYWSNTQFSSLDACTYYALICQLKPGRIIEIGSGNSTFVARAAASTLPVPPQIICIDPQPRADISKFSEIDFIRDTVQSVDIQELFGGLNENDIIFYDGSHTLKTGSDTVYFYLKILPYLPKGVMVHAHDVLLPWARRAASIVDAKISWSEQYLLMAHLHNTKRYGVRIASHYLSKVCPEEAALLIQNKYSIYGGSLWFEVLV